MSFKKYFLGIAFMVLFLAGCSSDDGKPEDNDSKNLRESEEEIAPDFTDIDDTADTLRDPVPIEDFEPETVPSNTDVTYDLDINMEDDGTFQLDTHVTVENTSDDSWEDLVFYVIPNAFTEENKSDAVEGASEFNMDSVQVNGESVPYSLDNDTLTLELDAPLETNEKIEADISYEFTIPDKGFRFTQSDEGYFLGQFYPMLATYQNGWNKKDFNATGESYHTDFSDFTVHYDVPAGYTVVGSDD